MCIVSTVSRVRKTAKFATFANYTVIVDSKDRILHKMHAAMLKFKFYSPYFAFFLAYFDF